MPARRTIARRQVVRWIAAAVATTSGAALLGACTPAPAPGATQAPAKPAATSAPAATTQPAAPAAAAPAPTSAPAANTAPAAAAATTAPAAPKPAAAAPSGSLIIGQDVAPVNLDVQKTGSFPSVEAFEHMYESLAMFDKDLQVQPSLAESWEIPDPTTYVFHLRKGVKWHNGREFVAKDVAYWHERIMDPKTASGDRSTFAVIKQIDMPDDYTVKMTLNKPFASLLPAFANLRGSCIPNKETVEQYGDLTQQAVGTGPFKLAEYVPSDRTRYVRNPDYWAKDQPGIQELTLKVMPDEDQRVAALRTGQIHLTTIGPVGAQRLANDPSVTVVKGKKAQLWYILVNSQKKPFDDVRVRKAMSIALDRQAFIEKAVQGEGAISGPVPTGHTDWFIPPEQLPYKQDIEGAKKLLAEAGFPNGFATTIKTSAAYTEMSSSAVELKNQLAKIGIDLTVQQVEWGQLTSSYAVGGPADKIADYELATARYIFFPDPDVYIGSFAPERNFVMRGNNTALVDPTLTSLLDQAQATLDHNARRQLYMQAQTRMLTEDFHAIWLFNGNQIDGMSKKLQNYWQSFTGLRSQLKYASLTS